MIDFRLAKLATFAAALVGPMEPLHTHGDLLAQDFKHPYEAMYIGDISRMHIMCYQFGHWDLTLF